MSIHTHLVYQCTLIDSDRLLGATRLAERLPRERLHIHEGVERTRALRPHCHVHLRAYNVFEPDGVHVTRRAQAREIGAAHAAVSGVYVQLE